MIFFKRFIFEKFIKNKFSSSFSLSFPPLSPTNQHQQHYDFPSLYLIPWWRLHLPLPVVVVFVNYHLSPENRCPSQYINNFDFLQFLDCNDNLFLYIFGLSECFLVGEIGCWFDLTYGNAGMSGQTSSCQGYWVDIDPSVSPMQLIFRVWSIGYNCVCRGIRLITRPTKVLFFFLSLW